MWSCYYKESLFSHISTYRCFSNSYVWRRVFLWCNTSEIFSSFSSFQLDSLLKKNVPILSPACRKLPSNYSVYGGVCVSAAGRHKMGRGRCVSCVCINGACFLCVHDCEDLSCTLFDVLCPSYTFSNKKCPIMAVLRWNSWKYNFVVVSGHNLEVSQSRGFFLSFFSFPQNVFHEQTRFLFLDWVLC